MKVFYRIFVGIVILLLTSTLAFTFFMMPRGEKLAENRESTKNEEKINEPAKINVFDKEKNSINILLIGLDSSKVTYEVDENSKRADTIMLMTIDPKKNKTQIISIPRDTYYKVKGYDNYKINAAYSRGGLDLQVSSVEDFMDLKIDHYLVCEYDAVKELVDAIGGVEIYTPEYSYTDPSTIPPLEINFHEGLHNLNGEDAVKYLRIRKFYENQDLGRIEAQQGFIMKIFEKMHSGGGLILKIPKLVSIANKYVKTDLSYGQLSYLAYYAMSLDKNDIEFKTLVGERAKIHGIEYYKVDKEIARNVHKEFLNREEENPENLTDEERQKLEEGQRKREELNKEAEINNSLPN
ncbi:LCP family protein [Peptoniphilus raoultii]|uniref:LCP family protein n=2 Tax=Peptoniphilus TaxID=162289 RepID=UPI0008D95C4F|nr:LCP family protein [Peptoniphilus raoultii]